MKKIFLFIIVGLFLVNFSSAGLFDPNSELAFHEEGKNGKYGYYEINDTTFWFFNNKPVKTIELIENEYSVFTAWNIKEIEVFKPTKLFDKTNYLDKAQKENRENLLSSELHFFREWETKDRTVNNKSCLSYETTANQTQICSEYQDNYYEETYEEWSDWKIYNFQTVQEGLYQTETIVTREKQGTGTIDWVDENEGYDLDEWATWWDTDWNFKRDISNLTGNISALFSITWDSDMKTDFGDLRFLDTATENIELNYTIEKFTASTNAVIRVNNLGASSVQMYYGNAAVSTTESTSDVYYNPVSAWFFDDNTIDFVNGNNGTIVGGVSLTDGYINRSYDFDGTTGYMTFTSSPFNFAGDFTLNAWVNFDSLTGAPIIFHKFENTGYYLRVDADGAVRFNIFTPTNYNLVTSPGDITTGAWYMVTAVRSGSELRVYVNAGTPDTLSAASGSVSNIRDLYLARVSHVSGQFLNGRVDEPLALDKALTQDQITSLFNQTAPLFITGAEQQNVGVSTDLISPEDNENVLNNTVTFDFTSIPLQTNLTNATLYIWRSNGTLIDTNFTTLSGNESVNTTLINTLEDGMYKWNAETCGEVSSCSFAPANNSFIVHVTPITIDISKPVGTIEFIKIGNNETLNWTLTELGENLTEHVINCSFTYNSVITYLPINTCTAINTTEFIYVLGENTLTFNTTDIFNLTSNETTTWDYQIIEINQTFNNETLEGAAEDFSAIIKLGPGETIGVVALVYNGSATAGTSSALGNNTEIKIEDFIIPQVSTDTNITFFWSIVLTGGEVINLTSNNQTIRNIDLDNCSSFSNQILNLSMVDEEEQFTLSNTTIEIAVNLLSVDRTETVVSLSGDFEGQNPLGICLSENITENIMYSLDAIIKYTSIGYAIEYYNLVNSSLDNESTTQSITLFNLNASDSTDFQLTFNGEDFLPVEGALIFIERQYIAENTFKTVELPKTDSNGQTILHLVRNDIVYNIRVVKEGQVLGTFLNIIAFCQDFTIGDCTIPLNAQSNTTGIFNYDDEVGILYDSPPTYNATLNTVSFDFTSTSGSTKVVEMSVERRDIFGNNSVCSNTLISTSGTVSCNIGLNLTDTVLFTTITIDGEEWIADSTIIDDSNLGSIGFVIWLILALSLMLMFAESKNGVMLSVAISYIGAVTLGISSGTLTGIGSAGIWALVITSIGIWKVNKNRKT